MTWPVPYDGKRITLHVDDRITREDADRQERTVMDILARLQTQPGLILADEVGMGKTFVALAVAAHAAWADCDRRPVVVMVPPSLQDKWPRDFEVFRTRCLLREEDRGKRGLRAALARTGLEFFKLIDDPRSRRSDIIFLTHGAVHRGLTDDWTKLLILKEALRSRRFDKQRKVFHRFVAEILQNRTKYSKEGFFEVLLKHRHQEWREIFREFDYDMPDDPVPEAVGKVVLQGKVDLSELHEALYNLPLRDSANRDDRILAIRRTLRPPLKQIWFECLTRARFRSPLLILDEAHHLKNPETRLASLFVDVEATEEAQLLDGALKGRFERMLFLTATPFQLGHRELVSVLDRFRGIRWKGCSPAMGEEGFKARLKDLSLALDRAQLAAEGLDRSWGVLREADLLDASGGSVDLETWWERVRGQGEDAREQIQFVLRAYNHAMQEMREAERCLQPWVIRHLRKPNLPVSEVRRRALFPGSRILDESGGCESGLAIRDEALLPFLLAARCEALLSGAGYFRPGAPTPPRATFSEGLASSYEAYLETRRGRDEGEDSPTDEVEASTFVAHRGHEQLSRYLDCLTTVLPGARAYADHPKIQATVRKALDLWRQGEKVLVFCHFRATGRALAQHISRAMELEIRTVAARRMGVEEGEVEDRIERAAEAFDWDRPVGKALQVTLDGMLSGCGELSNEEREKVGEIIRRFVRTPSFLVRYFPFDSENPAQALEASICSADSSGLNLRDKLVAFIAFIARRCQPSERTEYLDALHAIQTGERRVRLDDESLGHAIRILPSIRLANGAVKQTNRRRLLLAFNTPFFPEILIASSVLAEGVDLHLDCRHVIHHDLCWNPSTLEQRTGRVDRIGAKAERVLRPIHVYLPYVAGTQDEKMFRVVRDRGRWFHVIMGERYEMDEVSTERYARRVPLPEAAAQELAFRLGVG
ncbi:MAG: helicase-related protein [Planctomycetota bacterium]